MAGACAVAGATSRSLICSLQNETLSDSFCQRKTQSLGASSSSLMGNKGLSKELVCSVGKPGRCQSSARSLRALAAMKDIPKQFRQENLKDGLMENFKNVPSQLYGLNADQMDMFMNDNSPILKAGERMTAEAISSAAAYCAGSGVPTVASLARGRTRMSMASNISMSAGVPPGARSAPPDLPSLLLDARICYLGMPIVPEVTELIIAELLWLDYDSSTKPIYLYINSTGTQNEKRESIAFETEAYAIADTLKYVRPKIYTVNCGMAYGQAAMLLAMGDKGCRQVQPNSVTLLYSPKAHESGGSTTDMYIKAKELDANTQYYIELLATGTGKPADVIARDIRRTKYYHAEEAIEYGLADHIIQPRTSLMERKNYDEMLAQSKAQQGRMGRPGEPAAAGTGGGPGRKF